MAWAVRARNKGMGAKGYVVFRELRLGAPCIEIFGAIFPSFVDEATMAEKPFLASALPTKVKRQLARLASASRDALGFDPGAMVTLMRTFNNVFGAAKIERARHREDVLFD
jgi:hypothetical protein